jgi:hypothetical protein
MTAMIEEKRKALPQRFVSWADRRHLISIRTAVLSATVWMTWRVTEWAMTFAYTDDIDPIGKAAIIAAVTACVAALQAFAFRDYMNAKDGTP